MVAPKVENIPVAGRTLEERRTAAMEAQATAATAQAATAAAVGAVLGATDNPQRDRYERILIACVQARVSSDVEGFLKFAQELCDGIDRQFQADGGLPVTPAGP